MYIYICMYVVYTIYVYMNGGFSIAMFDCRRGSFTMEFRCPILRQTHRNTENNKR